MAHPTLAPPPTDQPGPGWPVSRLVAGIGVIVVVVAALIYLTGGAPGSLGHRGPDHTPAVGRGGLDSARLEVTGGVDHLTVTTADLGGDLVRARTPDDERAVPVLERDSGSVSVRTEGRDDSGNGGVDLTVTLNRDVRWSVTLDSGTSLLTLGLARARLQALAVEVGVSTIDADLPRPGGVLVTRISGGAGAVHLHTPAGVPARLTFGGGGGSADVDGVQHAGLPGGAVLTTPDWPSASSRGSGPGRLDVVLASGIGSVTLDR